MKKGIISVFLVICAVFCLTGCGKKPATLTCTQKVSSVDIQLTANFLGSKINAMSMKYDMDLSKYSDTLISTLSAKDYCSTVQSSMRQFTLVGCKQAVENKHIIVSSGIDISKISSKDLIGSPVETQKALENQGYNCVLK